MAADAATGHKVASSSTEDTGGFAFFRRHQKSILYTAVLFALVTFSIPFALESFFTPTAAFKGPTMKIGDRTIQVTLEDSNVGSMMLRAQGDPALVLPNLATGTDNDGLRDRFTALRRLAIEFGIEVSDDQVDRAIAQAVKVLPTIDSEVQLAVQGLGYDSLQAYRNVVKEALRIGTFLRLQVAGADTFDSALAQKLLDDMEVITLTVAAFDKKAVEEALKEKGVSNEELETWVADLPEQERRPFQAPNRTSLRAVGIVYDEFDAAVYPSELEGVEFDEARLRTEYARRKAKLFRVEKPEDNGGETPREETPKEEALKEEAPKEETPKNGKGDEDRDGEQDPPGQEQTGETEEAAQPEQSEGQTPESEVPSEQGSSEQGTNEQEGENPQAEGQAPTPPEDEFVPFEEVKDRLERMLLAEAVLDQMRFGKIEEAMAEHMLDAIEARNAAVVAVAAARKALAEAEEKLEQDPDNDDKKQVVDAAKAAIEPAEQAEKAAAEALDAQRRTFDFTAQMEVLIAGRKGFATHAVAEPVASADLAELGPLGKWDNSAMVETVEAAGEMSTQIQRTDKACFHFQVPDILKNPLKPFDEIADQARAEYFVKKADEAAVEASEKLEAHLLENAKAKIADEVAELEKTSAQGVEEKFSTWKAEHESELAKARDTLVGFEDRPQSLIYKTWRDQVTRLEGIVERQDEKRKELEEAAAEQLEIEIKKAARKVYQDVLADSVKDTQFTIEEVGAYAADLSTRPRFEHRFSEKIRFLFSDSTVRDLKEGAVTDVLDDTTGRALYVVTCKSRVKATMGDLTRRDLDQRRMRFVRDQLTECMEQSFSLEALEERWGYESPTSREEVDEPAKKN